MSKFIPNSFQVPNTLVDELLADMSDAALRTYMVIVRKTRGWNKECDRISLSQFEKIGGKSKNTIRAGLIELVALGLIIKHETAAGDAWELNDAVSKSDIANNEPVSKSDTVVYQNLNLAVSKSDNTENNYIKTTNKKTSADPQKQEMQSQSDSTIKTKSTSKPKSKNTPLPKNFGISEQVRKWAEEKGHTNLELHLEDFIGKALAKGYTYANWDAAFQNAIRNNWAGISSKQTASPIGAAYRPAPTPEAKTIVIPPRDFFKDIAGGNFS